MPLTTKTAHVTADQSGRVDRVVQSLTSLSHRKMAGLFDHGCVTINGRPCDHAGKRVKPGDRVEVCYDPHQGYREKKKKWADRAFSIVYEDSDIIVVNKSANVLTVATDAGEFTTLASRVSHYLKQTSRQREALVAHRLDRGVSGLLVFAKSPAMLKSLQQQFKQRKPERLYIAIVAGIVKPAAGTFRSYLETTDNLDQRSTPDDDRGQLAITHYRVQRELPDTTVVEVRLETGRRNQIRVHFADHGHPVLGDPRYRKKQAMHDCWTQKRVALHAISLGLDHPATGERMYFESELPKSMQRFIGK
ncbi:MAG TPA: RluA family pseudouridine synthase [Lacipirellulaceae bacterium]|jgi:23S rRNA pseudouridine1911/1915/1917 synthase